MRHEPQAEGILDIEAFGGDQITSHFGSALAESHTAVVESDRLMVQTVVRVQAWRRGGEK